MATYAFGTDILQEELEALGSLFCLPGECHFEGSDVVLNLSIGMRTDSEQNEGAGKDKIEHQPPVPVKIVIHISNQYPSVMPQVSLISDEIDRELLADVKLKISDYCSELLGEPMLVSLALYLKNRLEELVPKLVKKLPSSKRNNEKISDNCSEHLDNQFVWTSVLLIDHMRSKSRYCKTLEKWTVDLMLYGRIIFCRKLILVILQGDALRIKEFIVRLKTVSVDIDSRGHNCKEKMMKFLCEEKSEATQLHRFTSFSVAELVNRDDLKKLFLEYGLETIYDNHIMTLK